MLTIAYEARTLSVRVPVPILRWSATRRRAARVGRTRAKTASHEADGVLRRRLAARGRAEHLALATRAAREADTERALALRAGAGV